MVTPTKYRSVFTGQEIDEAIATMRAQAIDGGTIVNDFNGGPAKIASAELAKILKDLIDTNNDPTHIRAQLLSVADTHVFNDVEYARFNFLTATSTFRGGYPNAAVRDAALASEYLGYTGVELTFLEDDGSGDSLQELSKWDTTANGWKKIQLYNEGGTVPQVVGAASAVNLFNYRTARYSAMKCLIHVCNATKTQRQVQEVLITHVGTDTYLSVYSEVGNVSNLFNVSTTISAGIVTLVVTTLAANLTLSGKKLAML